MATLADLQNQRKDFFKQRGAQDRGQIQGETQGNVDALKRRFQSFGALNTGAAIGAEQKVRDQGLTQQRAAATNLAGQQLQAGEADFARAQQASQAQRQRDFQGGLAGKDLEFKSRLAKDAQSNKLRELDLAFQQFELDKDTTAFNKRLAIISANENAGGDGGIFDSIGSGNFDVDDAITGGLILGPGGVVPGGLVGGTPSLPNISEGAITGGAISGGAGAVVGDILERAGIKIPRIKLF